MHWTEKLIIEIERKEHPLNIWFISSIHLISPHKIILSNWRVDKLPKTALGDSAKNSQLVNEMDPGGTLSKGNKDDWILLIVSCKQDPT